MDARFPMTRWTPTPAELPRPTIPGGTGALDRVEHIPLPGGGPEDVVLDGDGGLYTGLHDGRVVRADLGGGPATVLANTGGRPLGVEWLPDGDLLVCDAHVGLVRVPRGGGSVQVLCSHVGDRRLVLTNNAAVEPDGTIWFTESTRCHPLEEFLDDVLEHNGSGRLLRRDPDGDVEEVLTGLSFANGVALVGDDEVWVAETGAYAIHRVRRHGPDAGSASLVTDRLGGFPDNLSVGEDGTVWAPVVDARNPIADRLWGMPPVLRRIVKALPEAVRPAPGVHAEVVGFAPDGSVRHHLVGRGREVAFITGAREHDGWLYLGSLREEVTSVARVRVPAPTR